MSFPGDCTPDRSKLFGSHGQRPWFHDVMKLFICSMRALSGFDVAAEVK